MPIRADYAEVPTTDLFVPDVVFRTACAQHNADFGISCFSFNALSAKRKVYGICNHRALNAGMNGPIRDQSIRVNSQRA